MPRLLPPLHPSLVPTALQPLAQALIVAAAIVLCTGSTEAQTCVEHHDIYNATHDVGPFGSDPKSSDPGPKHVFQHRVVFGAQRPTWGGFELCWTDLSVNNNYPLRTLPTGHEDLKPDPYPDGSNPRDFIQLFGRLYFVADVTVNGIPREGVLHCLGPEAGATDAKAIPLIHRGQAFFEVENLMIHGQELWFTATGIATEYAGTGPNQTGFGRYPWRIFKRPGQRLRASIVFFEPPNPVRTPNVLSLESAFNGVAMNILFPRLGQATEIWLSQGHILTSRALVVNFGQISLMEYDPVSRLLYFAAQPPWANDVLLFQTDGTGLGSVVLLSTLSGNTIAPRSPLELTAHQGRLYFRGTDTPHGVELWRSSGSPASTEIVMDLWPGPESSVPVELTPRGAHVFFVTEAHKELGSCVQGPGFNDGLYKHFVASNEITTVQHVTHARNLTVLGPQELLYFAGDAVDHDDNCLGNELWVSNGRSTGTELCCDIWPGSEASNPQDFLFYEGSVVLTGELPEIGRELLWLPFGI